MKLLLILSLLFGASSLAARELSTERKAKDYAEAGWNFFYFGSYERAEEMLGKSYEINPKDSDVAFGYGKVLIKNERYKKAFEVLEKTSAKADKRDERNFLLGVAALYTNKKEKAKEYFSAVTGGEYSGNAKSYLKSLEDDRYHLNAQFGLLYDSQIIDESLLATTDGDGTRAFSAASLSKKWRYWNGGQLGFRGEYVSLRTFDDDLSLADPFQLSLRMPWLGTQQIGKKNYILQVSPAVEMVWLDIDNSGSRSYFMTRTVLESTWTEQKEGQRNNSYYLRGSFNLGADDSIEDTGSDVDGMEFRAGWRHTKFLSSNKHLWQTNTYYHQNIATGDDIQFTRVGINALYLKPWKKLSWGVIGELRYTDFPHSAVTGDEDNRRDYYFAASVLARRSLQDWLNLKRDWLQLEARTGYAHNDSNNDDREFDQIITSLTLNGNWSF